MSDHTTKRRVWRVPAYSELPVDPQLERNTLDHLSTASIDWSKYKSGNIPYTLRQEPGPKNALGRVKIMFPNSYSVYLHDTPHKEHFADSARAFSSGCMRVERPFELAERVLNDGAWNASAIAGVVAAADTRTVRLKRPATCSSLCFNLSALSGAARMLSEPPQQILPGARGVRKFPSYFPSG